MSVNHPHVSHSVFNLTQQPFSGWLISDCWPSWLYAIPHLSLQITKIFTPDLQASWVQILKPSFPRVSWDSLDQFQRAFRTRKLEEIKIIFIQGSLSLWNRFVEHDWCNIPVLFSFMFQQTPAMLPYGWFPLQWTHREAGGVLAGRWMVALNSFVPPPIRPTQMLSRHLQHIIDPTTRLASLRCISRPAKYIKMDDLLPAAQWDAFVQCASVFAPKQWVYRPLSSSELKRAFDVPATLLVPETVEFTHAAPAKLLFHCWQCSWERGGGCFGS